MGIRKVPLVNGEVYHIFAKSIAGFKIFRNKSEYKRMRKLFSYYRAAEVPLRFSSFLEIKNKEAQHILNSYSRYFNLKNKRQGPLWAGRFGNKLVDRDEYFLHLSKYIHLNPVSQELVDRPEDWPYSSYRRCLGLTDDSQHWLSSLFNYADVDSRSYKKFRVILN